MFSSKTKKAVPLIDSKGLSAKSAYRNKPSKFALGHSVTPTNRKRLRIEYEKNDDQSSSSSMDPEAKRLKTEKDQQLLEEEIRREAVKNDRPIYIWGKDKSLRVWLLSEKEVDEQYITPDYHGNPMHYRKNNNPNHTDNANKVRLTVEETLKLKALYKRAQAINKMDYNLTPEELRNERFEPFRRLYDQSREALPKGPTQQQYISQGFPDLYLFMISMTYTVDKTNELSYKDRLSMIAACCDMYGRHVSLVIRGFQPYIYTRIPISYSKRLRHSIRDQIKENPELASEESVMLQQGLMDYCNKFIPFLEKELMNWCSKNASSGNYNRNNKNNNNNNNNNNNVDNEEVWDEDYQYNNIVIEDDVDGEEAYSAYNNSNKHRDFPAPQSKSQLEDTSLNDDEKRQKARGGKTISDLCWVVPPPDARMERHRRNQRNYQQNSGYDYMGSDMLDDLEEDQFYETNPDTGEKQIRYERAIHQNFKDMDLHPGSLITRWKLCASDSMTGVGYAPRRKESFIKITLAHPSLVPVLRDLLWNIDTMSTIPPVEPDGPLPDESLGPADGRKCWMVMEAKTLFPSRYRNDQDMVFMGWNHLPKQKYRFVPDSRRQTSSDMEIECHYDAPCSIHPNAAAQSNPGYEPPPPVPVASIPGWENSEAAKDGKNLQDMNAPFIVMSEDGEMCKIKPIDVQRDGNPSGAFIKASLINKAGILKDDPLPSDAAPPPEPPPPPPPLPDFLEGISLYPSKHPQPTKAEEKDEELEKLFEVFRKAFEEGNEELMKAYAEAMEMRGMRMKHAPDEFPDPRTNSIVKWACVVFDFINMSRPQKFQFTVGALDKRVVRENDELKDATVFTYSTEKEMLEDLVLFRQMIKSHVWLSYNGDSFDHPFLMGRCKILGIPLCQKTGTILKMGTYFSNRTVRGRNRTDLKISGVFSYDFLKHVMMMGMKPFKGRSYTLADVAMRLLGITKIDFGHTWIGEAQKYLASRTAMAAYNMRDAMLPMLMMQRYFTLFPLIEDCRLLATPPQELMDSGSMNKLSNCVMAFKTAISHRLYDGKMLLMPTAVYASQDDSKVEGSVEGEDMEVDYQVEGSVDPGGATADVTIESDDEDDEDEDMNEDGDEPPNIFDVSKGGLGCRPKKVKKKVNALGHRKKSGRGKGGKKVLFTGAINLKIPNHKKHVRSKHPDMRLRAKNFYPHMIPLLDFNSLYPSIQEDFNACLTTIILEQKIRDKMKMGEQYDCYEDVKLVELDPEPVENDYDYDQIDDEERDRRREIRRIYKHRRLEVIPMSEEAKRTRAAFVRKHLRRGLFPEIQTCLKKNRKIEQGKMKKEDRRLELFKGYAKKCGLLYGSRMVLGLIDKNPEAGILTDDNKRVKEIDQLKGGLTELAGCMDFLRGEAVKELLNPDGCNDSLDTKNQTFELWRKWLGLGSPGESETLEEWIDRCRNDPLQLVVQFYRELMEWALVAYEKCNILQKCLNFRQTALKLAGNSLYGMTGCQFSTLKMIRISLTVTKRGQHLDMFSLAHIENVFRPSKDFPYYAYVVYGDTDSIAILLIPYHKEAMMEMTVIEEQDLIEKMQKSVENAVKINTRKQAEINIANKIGKDMQRSVNGAIKAEFKTEVMNIELEKTVENAILDSQKKYSGLYHFYAGRSSFEIKGLPAVRADTPEFLAKLQRSVLEKLVKDNDFEGAFEYAVQAIAPVRQHIVPACTITGSKSFSTDPELYKSRSQPHVSIALRHKAEDPDFPEYRAGNRMKPVKVELENFAGTPHYDKARVSLSECSEEVLEAAKRGMNYDADYYIQYAWNSIRRLLWRPSPYVTIEELDDRFFADKRIHDKGRFSAQVLREYREHLNEMMDKARQTSNFGKQSNNQKKEQPKRGIINSFFKPKSDVRCRLCAVVVDSENRPYIRRGEVCVCNECVEAGKDEEYLIGTGKDLKMWTDKLRGQWTKCGDCLVGMKMVETKLEETTLSCKASVQIEDLARSCSQRDCNDLYGRYTAEYFKGLHQFELEKWGVSLNHPDYSEPGTPYHQIALNLKESRTFVPAYHLKKNYRKKLV